MHCLPEARSQTTRPRRLSLCPKARKRKHDDVLHARGGKSNAAKEVEQRVAFPAGIQDKNKQCKKAKGGEEIREGKREHPKKDDFVIVTPCQGPPQDKLTGRSI